MDKISIIIPFYNCPYVDQAIESALAQTYPNVEVIVVNDGSTQFTHKIKKYFGRIEYIEKGNGGTATALNAGIRRATGDYFSWLSSDDIYQPQKLEKQLHFMKEQKGHAVYSPVSFINSQSEVTDAYIGHTYPDKIIFFKQLLKGCFINGCSVLLDMDVFSKLGVFNEALRYAHDYDMWLRIAQYYNFAYFDEPVVFYRIHEAMGTKQHTPIILRETRSIQRQYADSLKMLMIEEVKKRQNR